MTTLGFIGLGHMGANMAARFLAAGYTVYGESRHRRDAHDLEGLSWRDTPREIAEASTSSSRPFPTTTPSRASRPDPTGSSRA
jgi:6-phosphogluconate dehydrogenase (decarboxylating)